MLFLCFFKSFLFSKMFLYVFNLFSQDIHDNYTMINNDNLIILFIYMTQGGNFRRRIFSKYFSGILRFFRVQVAGKVPGHGYASVNASQPRVVMQGNFSANICVT